MTVCTWLAAPSGLRPARAWRRGSGAAFALCLVALVLARPGAAEAADCAVTVEQTWLGDLHATAIASGDCAVAGLDLIVRNGVDEVVWSASYQSGDLMGFDGIGAPDDMRVAMEDWLGVYAEAGTTDTLPEWPQGADQPEGGEFPFYVAEELSRQDYEELRTGGFPMICYIQGRESTLCLVRRPDVGALISIGAQSFPG
ncbi:hypothetical protein [Hoeflea sp. BAL378]|uniref:hypothetical protein n=1 Tax=Hoeflea sp. BAL378 TaxID=1547437 RepID=UPI00126A26F9|nr:hypothetical protein [Hoeflea sp. BAL378]